MDHQREILGQLIDNGKRNLILYLGNKNAIKKKFFNVLFPSKAATPVVPGPSCQSICCLCLGPCVWVLKSPYGKMLIACMVGKWQVDCLPTAF